MAKKLAFLFTALALVGLVAGNRRAALDFTQRPLISTKPVRNVCLVFYQGIVHCDADKDPSTYSGYEVELFRKSSAYLYSKGREEWAPENYTFTCMGWDGLMEDLLLEPASRTCDVGVAGISATSERIAAGYHFTYPTYNSGRRIMVAMSATVDMFLFLRPFDQSVWLLLFTTSVVVCISVLLAEVPIRRIFRRPAPALEKYCNLQWAATGMLLQATQQFTAKSTGARLMILGYAFLVLIVINMYIATLASQLTVTTINLKVNGLSDVVNKPVGIFEADVDNFKRFNLDFAVPLPWNDAQVSGESLSIPAGSFNLPHSSPGTLSSQDEVNMIAQLRSGIVQALILDAPFVEYHAAESCDLYAVGEMLLPVNLAYAFPSDVPLDYIELFNQALTIMEEQGTMGDLQQQFITPPGGCPSKKSNVASSTISLQQVAGLWVFLGAAVVAGLSWNCCSWFLRHRLARGAGLKVSHSLNSTNSVLPSADSVAGSVRNRSLINANPELSWLSVAEATTQEEAMEMMEGHVKVVDQRVKHLSEAIEHRFASLNEQLFGLAPEPVYQVAFTRKK
ncbi:uncharacterized protein HaLaN_03912 [Haematococcus lacustris]|uniref:Ionotropic glutamate receptor C-terminal domain-containing protein n=1 Tax=Haematococcus lacustris TaxID=44745 RepID=A0A699YFP1_HAELA|nr:uncharacterized protein HaLaN_03912 [Haematococcus lacustris]